MAKTKISRLRWMIPLVIAILAITPALNAQDRITGSLKASLLQTGKDSIQYINGLNRISNAYLVRHLDSCRHYAEAALAIAARVRYHKGMGDAYLHLGHCFMQQEHYAVAYRIYRESLRRYNYMADSAGMALALGGIAGYFHAIGRKNEALPYLIQASAIGGRLVEDSAWAPVLIRCYEIYADNGARGDTLRRFLRQAALIAAHNSDPALRLYTAILLASDDIRDGRAIHGMEALRKETAAAAGIPLLASRGNALLDRFAATVGDGDSLQFRSRAAMAAMSGGFRKLAVGPAASLYHLYKNSAPALALPFADMLQEIALHQDHLLRSDEQAYVENFMRDDETKVVHLNADIREMEAYYTSSQRRDRMVMAGFVIVCFFLLAWLFVTNGKMRRNAKKDQAKLRSTNRQLWAINQEQQYNDDFKGQLIRILAHEFRFRLSKIADSTDSLRGAHHSPGSMREIAYGVALDANETCELSENLLRWVRSKLSGYQHNPKPFTLRELLDEVMAPLMDDVRDKAILLELQVPDGLVVLADREMLQFVHRSILHNAVKYSNRGSHVIVTCGSRNGRITFSVTNEGSGIPKEEIPYIFEYRPPGELVRQTGRSAGLTLIICRDFIECMGGRLTVRSDGERFATFEYIIGDQLNEN
ncbi:ATP-binding protein [Chitinophaga lutea]